MITIVIVLGMLVSFGTGAYTSIKAVQMGLKFKYQIEKKTEPKMDEPVKQFFDRKEEKKAVSVSTQMISDIMGDD